MGNLPFWIFYEASNSVNLFKAMCFAMGYLPFLIVYGASNSVLLFMAILIPYQDSIFRIQCKMSVLLIVIVFGKSACKRAASFYFTQSDTQ